MSTDSVTPVVSGSLTTVLMNVNAAAQDAAAVSGWRMLDGSELGVGTSLLNNGIYTNANAQAVVAIADYNGHRTLAIGFQGSNDAEDWRENFQNINSHYSLYASLIAGIGTAVREGNYDLVLVTGHSLGGAMAQMFMADYADIAPAYAITTGAPGYLRSGPTADGRIINYQISDDPVIVLADNRAEVGQILGSLDAATLTELATAVGTEIGFPADVLTSSVPFMTQNYYDHGTNLILPAPGHPSLAPAVESLLTSVNVDAHDLATYSANIGLVNANPFDLDVGSRGTDGNDALFGTTGNETIDGSAGTDILYLHDNRADLSVGKTTVGFTVTSLNSGTDSLMNIERLNSGTDSLMNIERLQFSDESLAVDMGVSEAGGKTALLLGACLGANGLSNQATVGGILGYFDGGFTLTDAAMALVDAGIVAQLAGGADNKHFVDWMALNLVDALPDASTEAVLIDFITSGQFTQATFLATLAAHQINQDHIGLTGLQDNGMEFV